MLMRAIVIVLTLCSALALAGCAPILPGSPSQLIGSGKLVTQDFTLRDFTRISAGSNFQVTLRPGAQFAVSITADDNVIEHVEASLSGDELRFRMKPGKMFGLTNVTMKADVSLPTLAAVRTTENASVHLGEVNGGDLSLSGNSNGLIDGRVAVSQLAVGAASNGQVRLSGTAESLEVEGQGNAILRLEELAAKAVRVDLGSNAKATVRATDSLDYSVGGNAGLTYSGGATLGEQKTGGNGTVRGR
jgi:hypothetical protein